MSASLSRRAIVTGSAASLAVSFFVPRRSLALEATPQASPVAEAAGRFLLVADPAVEALSIYSIPGLQQTGSLAGIALDKHAGVIALADGRVLFNDDAAGEVVAMMIDANGVPSIVDRVKASFGDGAAWAAIDTDARHYLVTGGVDESRTRYLNVVDLGDFTNTSIEIEAAADEELEAWISGDPAMVYLAVGGRVDAYSLEALRAGDANPVSILDIELGSHGPVADAARNRLLISTKPGFEVIELGGEALTWAGLVPWEVDGFTGGQNFRPRLGWAGSHVFGVLTSEAPAPEAWAESEVSAHITDLAELTARRVRLGRGLWAGRWGIGSSIALFAGHDGEQGSAVLFDVDPASSTFATMRETVTIDLPTAAAKPGQSAEGSEGYLTAITHDGDLGFVALGGDGRVLVIDTNTATVIDSIEAGTPLTGAGYLTVIEPGLTPVDLMAR